MFLTSPKGTSNFYANKLFLGDCLQVMSRFHGETFDAIVTDPPFGIGFDYDGKKDVAKNAEDYWTWFQPRYIEILRALKPGGFCAIWQPQKYLRHAWDWFGPDIHIFIAGKKFVQLRKTPINYAYDPVVMFYKPGAEPLRPKPKHSVDIHMGNTMPVRKDKKINHPCPRPLDTVEKIVDNFVIEDGTVLDPFMGSGTTAVACKNTNRFFTGIEIERSYFATTATRLKTN